MRESRFDTSLYDRIDGIAFDRVSGMSLFARSVFDDSIRSLFEKDYLLADSVVMKAKTITSMESEAIKVIAKKVEAVEMSSIRLIMESIRRTAEYASDIAEIVLNLNVNQIIMT
jgi:predicted nucleotidyltransferase